MPGYQGLIAETININGHNGDLIDAYLARPLGPGPHPGVVMIHHMPGWDDATKIMAAKLAYHGYATILPNLQFREGKATPQENSASVAAAGGMPDERTMGDVQASINYLRTLPYAIVVGEKEQTAGTINPRSRDRGERGEMEIPAFLESIALENAPAAPPRSEP